MGCGIDTRRAKERVKCNNIPIDKQEGDALQVWRIKLTVHGFKVRWRVVKGKRR